MRRFFALLVACLLLPAGVVTATTAAADVVPGGVLTSGTPVTGTVTVPNRDISYTFQGTLGVHSTMDVRSTGWGAGNARLNVFLPSGGLFISCLITTAPTFCEFTPTITGTWKATLDPTGTAVGSATFAYATDVAGGALAPGVARTVALGSKGQNASFTSAQIAGVPFTVNVTASNWGAGGAARLYFYRPGTTTLFSYCNLGPTPTTCPVYPDRTGAWRIDLDPLASATGSVTFAITGDQDKGTLTPDNPVPTTITVPGQNARYAFTATAGTHVDLSVPTTNWGGGTASLNVFGPGIGLYVSCPLATAATFCDFTPNASGAWQVVLDPAGNAVGNATVTLVNDQAKGPLMATPATATIATPGQNATFTFAGTAGAHSTIDVASTGWGTGRTAWISLYQPDGELFTYCEIAAAPTYCEFTPEVTGPWKAVLDPQGGATGSAALAFGVDQNKGALTPGTPVTTAIALRGQNANYTFTATAGTPVTFTTTASNWGAGGAARLYIFEPGSETLYDYCTLGTGATACITYPDATGTWRLVLDPIDNALGSATFRRN